jgi:predicted lipoprotein with Yx(FWY)xxD motif
MAMKKVYFIFLAVLTLIVFSSLSMAMHHAVKIAQKEGVGKYLTDTEGKTLYWFKKDSKGNSACIGPCLEKWPIYFREKVAPPKGISQKKFGTITRADGKKQTTFKGFPLYYWAGDINAGDTNGQGFNDIWSVVNPDNFPPKK